LLNRYGFVPLPRARPFFLSVSSTVRNIIL
jgi:hypothetical protein